MKRLIGVVQARMGSTRLPGKVMKPLADLPLIEHIYKRLIACDYIQDVVLATTQMLANDW